MSVEVYTYIPPEPAPCEALFALMRPLDGTVPFGPFHWKDRGLSDRVVRLKEQLTDRGAPARVGVVGVKAIGTLLPTNREMIS